jgi:hypothetical protein
MVRSSAVAITLALALVTACGGVTPVARSERAAVGWGFLSAKYCMEPANSADQAGAPLILGYADASGQKNDYGLNARASQSARGREVAEIMLFARESLYRICEARRNGDLCKEEAAAERTTVYALVMMLIEEANAHDLEVLKNLKESPAASPATGAPSSTAPATPASASTRAGN